MTTVKRLSPSGLTATFFVAVCVSAAAQLAEPVREIYTCVDAKGRKLTADRSIAECADREQKILNPSGTVKKSVGPTLTAIEREQLDVQAKAMQKEAARLEEEKKRDRALLVRYPSEALHQREREDSLRQVMVAKQAALTRTTALIDERAKLENEMDFYVKDPSRAPANLRQQLESVTQALAVQAKFLAERDAELARINARFDAELARLRPLWRLNEVHLTR